MLALVEVTIRRLVDPTLYKTFDYIASHMDDDGGQTWEASKKSTAGYWLKGETLSLTLV